jgi:hypothetical protein
MRPRTLLLIAILAALSFGGSFTCEGHSGGHSASTK